MDYNLFETLKRIWALGKCAIEIIYLSYLFIYGSNWWICPRHRLTLNLQSFGFHGKEAAILPFTLVPLKY